MEKTEPSFGFYERFFNEGLYLIKGKGKPYVSAPNAGHAVSETFVPYPDENNSHFEEITSGTLLMFRYPGTDEMPAGDKAFLVQILKAVGLGFQAVSRINTPGLGSGTDWEAIAARSSSDFVIAFGVDKAFLPHGIEEGQIYNINGKRVLAAASLPELIANSLRKKLLWQGLKEIYGI